MKFNDRTTGFDYLRLLLSIGVVVSHTVLASYGMTAQAAASSTLAIGIPQRLILPMFFSLSGFLVAGSLFRCKTLVMFLGLRVLRLVPALFCEVALSALLLGPIFTDLNLKHYFTDVRFYEYFLNIVGDIHYILPGIFANNPYPEVVNVQLWTIPWELYCYISLTVAAILGLIRREVLLVLGLIAIQLVVLLYAYHKFDSGLASPRGASGPVLIVAFFSGLVLYLYREKLPLTRGWFILSVMLCLCLEAVPFGNYLVAFPCAYMTVWLGLCNPAKVFPVNRGDYSYGIYLYGLPIQQAIAALGPPFQHWYISLVMGLALTFIIAAASWHWIEKPAQSWRPMLKKAEELWLKFSKKNHRIESVSLNLLPIDDKPTSDDNISTEIVFEKIPEESP